MSATIVEDAEDDVRRPVAGGVRRGLRRLERDDDVELDTVGWVSSFDGTPVPADEMAGVARRDGRPDPRPRAAARARDRLRHRADPGPAGAATASGTSAPTSRREVLDLLAARVAAPGSRLGHVELHRPSGRRPRRPRRGGVRRRRPQLGRAVLPGRRATCADVLGRRVRCVRPGGAVFVGDVRNLAVARRLPPPSSWPAPTRARPSPSCAAVRRRAVTRRSSSSTRCSSSRS